MGGVCEERLTRLRSHLYGHGKTIPEVVKNEDAAIAKFKHGVYDKKACRDFLNILKTIPEMDEKNNNFILIRMVWYVPVILLHWMEYLIKYYPENEDEIFEFVAEVDNELLRIIGAG